jgi:hypothetical protein
VSAFWRAVGHAGTWWSGSFIAADRSSIGQTSFGELLGIRVRLSHETVSSYL